MAKTPNSELRTPKSKKAYAAAGVDVDLGNRVKSGIHALVKGTHGPEVLGKIGGFGGAFRAKFQRDERSRARLQRGRRRHQAEAGLRDEPARHRGAGFGQSLRERYRGGR